MWRWRWGARVRTECHPEGTGPNDCNFPMRDFEFIGLYGIEATTRSPVSRALTACAPSTCPSESSLCS